MPKRKTPPLPAKEQSKRFIEKARELEVDETEDGQEKAFGKVGLGKPKKAKTGKKK